ncbi:unnamed protein product [Protopolystoma xenopodis]|uniref:Uncharacterized protein n=1 Tax=Protopolystoma xenopodis TaxID=117903 RepID=A0A448X0A9_9PLAT|nr:unnamed protein product [Protopolystoma xenopodis]
MQITALLANLLLPEACLSVHLQNFQKVPISIVRRNYSLPRKSFSALRQRYSKELNFFQSHGCIQPPAKVSGNGNPLRGLIRGPYKSSLKKEQAINDRLRHVLSAVAMRKSSGTADVTADTTPNEHVIRPICLGVDHQNYNLSPEVNITLELSDDLENSRFCLCVYLTTRLISNVGRLIVMDYSNLYDSNYDPINSLYLVFLAALSFQSMYFTRHLFSLLVFLGSMKEIIRKIKPSDVLTLENPIQTRRAIMSIHHVG